MLTLRKFGGGSRHSRKLRGAALAIILSMATVVTIAYMRPHDRSFLVEIETHGARLTFLESTERNNWKVGSGAVLCRWSLPAVQSIPSESRFTEASHPLCGPKLFRVQPIDQSMEFSWPQGSTVALRSGQAGELIVDILKVPDGADGVELGVPGGAVAKDSMLIIPRTVFLASGTLPFSGELSIGEEANAGERAFLRAGRFLIREALPLRTNPVTISSGQFNRGDRVTFRFPDDGSQGSVYGFVSADYDDDVEVGFVPFELIAYSEPAKTIMEIDRFAGRTMIIAPRWTDRAVNDPWLLGATVILTITALCASLVADGYSFVARAGTPSPAEIEGKQGSTQSAEGSSNRQAGLHEPTESQESADTAHPPDKPLDIHGSANA